MAKINIFEAMTSGIGSSSPASTVKDPSSQSMRSLPSDHNSLSADVDELDLPVVLSKERYQEIIDDVNTSVKKNALSPASKSLLGKLAHLASSRSDMAVAEETLGHFIQDQLLTDMMPVVLSEGVNPYIYVIGRLTLDHPSSLDLATRCADLEGMGPFRYVCSKAFDLKIRKPADVLNIPKKLVAYKPELMTYAIQLFTSKGKIAKLLSGI